MFKRLLAALLVCALAASGFWLFTRAGAPPSPPVPTQGADASGFARATEVVEFAFPDDHGPHFDYQTEWWYYTGNLTTGRGEHVGYQLTFFRRGLTPGAPPQRASAWATNQIYFAHLALTDVSGQRHTFAERFSRGAADLAGAEGRPFRVWLEDWRAESLDADGSAVRLTAREGGLALDLILQATKPLVAHGERGLSPKSDERGNASYYLSYTRMATEGQVTFNGESAAVRGESWFDHEWSTSALGPGAVGWDWFSLQLSDGRELMFFQIRRADGSLEPVSSGTLVEPDGRTVRLGLGDVRIDVLGTWRSPESRGVYPSRWRVAVPSARIELTVEPWVADQEMRVSFPYWEGAVRFTGASAGAAVSGNGYVELTGYASSMEGVF